jgi:hypothetical protein
MHGTLRGRKSGLTDHSRYKATPPLGDHQAGAPGRHPAGRPVSAPNPISAFFVLAGRDPLTEAFSEREFAPPWRGSVPIGAKQAQAVLAAAFATPRDEPASGLGRMSCDVFHTSRAGAFWIANWPAASLPLSTQYPTGERQGISEHLQRRWGET